MSNHQGLKKIFVTLIAVLLGASLLGAPAAALAQSQDTESSIVGNISLDGAIPYIPGLSGGGCSISLLGSIGGIGQALGSAAGSAADAVGGALGDLSGDTAAPWVNPDTAADLGGGLSDVAGDFSSIAGDSLDGGLSDVAGDFSDLSGIGDLGDLGFGDVSFGDIAGLGSSLLGGGGSGPVPVKDDVVRKKTSGILSIEASNQQRDNMLNCLARSMARIMLQQMTVSVVNWINSGFNGEPSFIRNYSQFFSNVADEAIGQVINGSDLAFLCSPFKLQVRIAVAQAYAYRSAPQCTLSQIIGNIDGFMNDFSQGGWPAFLSFTTVPTNNPFGAFMYADARVQGAIANAQGRRQSDLIMGKGFLSFQQEKNCRIVSTPPYASPDITVKDLGNDGYRVCDLLTSTPGSVISSSLDKTIGSNFDSLNSAKYFDEILSALITQLVQRTLYTGLYNLSSGGGYQYNFSGNTFTGGSVANDSGKNLSLDIENAKKIPQELLAIEEANLVDIQNSKNTVRDTSLCWQGIASSTLATPDQVLNAQNNITTASTTITDLGIREGKYALLREKAGQMINALTQYSDQAKQATSFVAVQQITQRFIAFSQGGGLATGADLNNAQQDRAKLQTDLLIVSQNAGQSYNECKAVVLSPTPSPIL